jgi:hypothetical protein
VDKVKFFLTISALAAGTVVCWLAFSVWNTERVPISKGQLALLNAKMDSNAVRALLGNPSRCETFTNALGRPLLEWEYSRPSGWKFVEIEFDENGHFQRHYSD